MLKKLSDYFLKYKQFRQANRDQPRFLNKRRNTISVVIYIVLIGFGIGFAPIAMLFPELGLGLGLYYDTFLSIVLFVRYRHYLIKSPLLLITALPLSPLAHIVFDSSAISLLWALKIYPFYFAWKTELNGLKHVYHKIYTVITILIAVLLVMHSLACGWLLIEAPFQTINYTAYNKALYWVITTLTTVGYGDIVPTSNVSRIFTAIVMLLGVGVYGVVISQMSRNLFHQDRRNVVNNEKLEHLHSFFKHYQIPEELRVETRAFFDHVLSKKSHQEEKELLRELPTKLKTELQTYMILRPISQTKIFKGCLIGELKDVLDVLENHFYAPGDTIFNTGDAGDTMYIIAHGHVDIFIDEQHIAELAQNQIFGEMSLVFNETRSARAVASTYVDLFKLSKENFHLLSKSHPTIRHNVDNIIKERKLQNKSRK